MPRRNKIIRIAVLDRHPAFRFGVDAFTKPERDIEVIGCAADTSELWPLLQRTDPDIVLIDHQPGRADRLALCLRIKARSRARIVLCTDEAEADLPILAKLAGADAAVDKAADPRHLLRAIRAVGAGEPALPPISPRAQARAGARLCGEDHPVYAMRLAGTDPADIAAYAGISVQELEPRLAAIMHALGPQKAESPITRFTRAAA